MRAETGAATKTLGDVATAALEACGVQVLFGLDDPQALFSARRRTGATNVIVHDERSGAFMADGFARAAGRVGVCAAMSGPGATNLATGLLEARKSSSPLVAIVAEPVAADPGREAYQGAPHEAILGPIVKQVVRIARPDDVAPGVRSAIAAATSGRPGPILLLVDGMVLEGLTEAALVERVRRVPPRPAPPAPTPRREVVESARALLRRAQRPVGVVGGGFHASQAYDALRTFAEAWDLPLAVTLQGKGSFDESHRLFLGVASSYTGGREGAGHVALCALADADVVVVLGSDLDSVTTGGRWPSASAEVIRVDIDPSEFRERDSLTAWTDAGLFVEALSESPSRTNTKTSRAAWATALRERRRQHLARLERGDGDRACGYVPPRAVAAEIGGFLRVGGVAVTDASYSSAWVLDGAPVQSAGRCVLAPRGTGVLGWGLPAALGARIARPSAPVTCVTGDGGLLYSVGELETAVRLGVSLSVIVLNNRSFAFQRHADRVFHDRGDVAELAFGASTDYVRLAESFGWNGVRCTTREALREALEHAGPILIEVPIDPDARAPILAFEPA